jgi:dephospho-CoA kinase
MFLVGLTGGIAAGKSTVAAHLVSLGAYEIDADKLAREVVEPGRPALAKIEAEFGSRVINSDGTLNRKALGEIVFTDPQQRLKLEAITHPEIRALSLQRIEQNSEFEVVIYNVPLLVEAKVDLPFDYVITVEAPQKEQVKRLVENRGLTEAAANSIIAAQASPAERANAADLIISSNQPLVLMLKDVDAAYRQILTLAEAKRTHEVDATGASSHDQNGAQ